MRAIFVLLCLVPSITSAADLPAWESALAQMRFAPGTPLLQRSNVIPRMLRTFRSNDSVKAIVVMPGVADDLYLIHRDAPPLNLEPTDLRRTMMALTNGTAVRLAFRNSFLLLHAPAHSPLLLSEPKANRPETVQRLQERQAIPCVIWEDVHWAQLQPVLRRITSLSIKPAPSAQNAWHFERVSIAACNLNRLELLQAVSWATGTELAIGRRSGSFSRNAAP